MAAKSYPDPSHDLKLRLDDKIVEDKPAWQDPPASPDQPCRKCDGEGYIVVRVYPWDGCSYDENRCDLCNPNHDDINFDDSGGANAI